AAPWSGGQFNLKHPETVWPPCSTPAQTVEREPEGLGSEAVRRRSAEAARALSDAPTARSTRPDRRTSPSAAAARLGWSLPSGRARSGSEQVRERPCAKRRWPSGA